MAQEMLKISILILPCARDNEDLIHGIMDSQTYEDIEWIIPEDGDTLFDEIYASTGEYVLILDSWYIWSADTAERLVYLMENEGRNSAGIIELRSPEDRKYHSADAILPPCIFKGDDIRAKETNARRQVLLMNELTIDAVVKAWESDDRKMELAQWFLFFMKKYEIPAEAGGDNLILQDIINLCDLLEGEGRFKFCSWICSELSEMMGTDTDRKQRLERRLGLWKPEILSDIETLNSEGYSVFLLKKPSGETSIYACLPNEYKEIYHKKTALIMIDMDRNGLELIQNSMGADKVITIDGETMFYLTQYPDLYAMNDVHNLVLMYEKYEGQKPSNMVEAACNCMGLSYDIYPKYYHMRPDNEEKVAEVFNREALVKGKTVFLVPYAGTLGNKIVPEEIWKGIVELLYKNGYKAVFNSEDEVVAGVPHFYMGIRDTVELIRLCGHVIGVRTGLLDVACAFTKADIFAIYPNESCPVWTERADLFQGCRSSGGLISVKALEYYSLRNMFKRDNVTEIICPINIDDLYHEIGQFL